MTSSPPTCVSWLLLASYAVLLGVGGAGVWASVTNFWKDEPLPPSPPPDPETDGDAIPTTTPSNHHGHPGVTENLAEMYQEYIYASTFFATGSSDSRLFVAVPCAVSVVVAALVLVAGLRTREFFSFTFSMYSSLGTLVVTLIWAVIYQNVVALNQRMNLDFMGWVLAFQVVLMVVLSTQILLCVWELRRQKAGWPTINFSNVFTVEAVLLTARMTLTVYTCMMMDWSKMFRGYHTEKDPRYSSLEGIPRRRCPLVLILVSFSAISFIAVTTSETMLSVLFGKLHRNMTTVTTLLSALCCITLAILNSPVVLKVITEADGLYPETMYFAIGLSVVLVVHMVASLVFPVGSRSPPAIITVICDLLETSASSLRNSSVGQQLLSLPLFQGKGKGYETVNLISLGFASVSLVILAKIQDSPMYYAWGTVIVMCANSAILVRTLPAFVAKVAFKEPDNMTVNRRVIAMSLECLALLVGGTAACALSWSSGAKFVAAMNLLFLAFQLKIMAPLVREIKPQTQSNEAESCAETEVLNEDTDEEQNPVVTLP